jgi:hypothetical protein
MPHLPDNPSVPSGYLRPGPSPGRSPRGPGGGLPHLVGRLVGRVGACVVGCPVGAGVGAAVGELVGSDVCGHGHGEIGGEDSRTAGQWWLTGLVGRTVGARVGFRVGSRVGLLVKGPAMPEYEVLSWPRGTDLGVEVTYPGPSF